MAQHNELGKWGEDLAARMLEDKGYRIIARDWKDGHKDLDIVAIDDGWLVVVEVKTRRNDVFLTLAANRFVKSNLIDLPIRFDIIAITGTDGEHCKVDHIEDAFMPYYFR